MTTGCGCGRAVSRRSMLGLFAGGGALLAAGGVKAAGHADVLLLTCMDYRLVNETEAWMTGRGYRDNYDHIVLAGASLGAVTDVYPAWREAFWTHLDVAVKLHDIHTVVVLDHDDCGAYKVLLGEAAVEGGKAFPAHVAHLTKLRAEITAKHPHLKVELNVMALDGTVRPVA